MVALGAADIVHRNAVVVRHSLLNAVGGDQVGGLVLEQLVQRLPGQLHVNGSACQAGIGGQAGQAALQLANIGIDFLGDQHQNIVADGQLFIFRLFAQNGQPGFKVRALNIRHQSALKAAAQAFLQLLNFLGGLIRRHHNLLVGVPQMVKGVEKFLLRPFFTGDKLDIVHQQNIRRAETIAELLVLVGLHGADQLIGKILAGNVQNFLFRVHVVGVMADGVHQVGFAQAHAPIDKQGVVRLGGHFGHSQGHGVGKPVGRTHHKRVKGILGVEHGQGVAALAGGQLVQPGLQFAVAQNFHADSPARRPVDRALNLVHVALNAHVQHGRGRAFQQQHVALLGIGLQRGGNPGIVADPDHLLLQQFAGARP